MSDENNMNKMVTYLPKYHEDKIRRISKSRHIPMARLVAFAIDRELQIERPFSFDYDFPDTEYIEYAYAEEASKILTFLTTLRKGAGLDILLLLRFKIGIPDKDIFLAAFRECLEKDMVESFVPGNVGNRMPHPDGYLYYRVTGSGPKEQKKMRKKSTEYEKYLKLKKKYEKED